jgi:predicted DsbA family dithiol-disulfide isomerase
VQIEIWSDVVCPWCYLGTRRLQTAVAELGIADVDVVHRAFQLDPTADPNTTVETTAMLAAKYGLTRGRAEAMQREMEQRAAEAGLEYHLAGQHSGNTRKAHRLLRFALEQGRQEPMVERLFQAYFTEGRSVFDDASLAALAADVGLDAAEVAAVLASDRYAAEVDADIAQARTYGVTGVPFTVIDRRFGVPGAQPVDTYRQVLERALRGAGEDTPDAG